MGPQEKESLRDLYRSPILRNRLLNVNFNWVVITLVYYGLSMNASSLAGDLFTNFTLLSVAEFPGYLLSYLGMSLVGRRATLAASLLIGGLSCLAASLTPGLLNIFSIESIINPRDSIYHVLLHSLCACSWNNLLPAWQIWRHRSFWHHIPLHQ